MYLPPDVLAVLTDVVSRSARDEDEVPVESHRHHSEVAYRRALSWLAEMESPPEFDRSVWVNDVASVADPGDLFRTVEPDGSTSDWRRLLGKTITRRSFVLAFADPESGQFEDLCVVHDSDRIDIITYCRVCEERQATRSEEFHLETGQVVAGALCDGCQPPNENPPSRSHSSEETG